MFTAIRRSLMQKYSCQDIEDMAVFAPMLWRTLTTYPINIKGLRDNELPLPFGLQTHRSYIMKLCSSVETLRDLFKIIETSYRLIPFLLVYGFRGLQILGADMVVIGGHVQSQIYVIWPVLVAKVISIGNAVMSIWSPSSSVIVLDEPPTRARSQEEMRETIKVTSSKFLVSQFDWL